MAIYINTLNGGNITVGSGGSPAPATHADTWYKYAGDTEWRTVSISGTFEAGSFENESDIDAVELGTNVTSIGDRAFYDCYNMTTLVIPNSVTSIGFQAFSEVGGLTSVTIPDSVTSIGDGAFEFCNGLTSVTIGDSVTSIGRSAFSGCSGLMSVTIPDSVTSIGDWAFSSCSSLTSITVLGKTTAQAQTLLADASVPEGCTITVELG
jgi:hypothetical protein